MEKQYLDYNGLANVAGHVNTRLKTVTTMPVSADNGAVRLYVGTSGSTYEQGHIYQYNSENTEWVDITPIGSGGEYRLLTGTLLANAWSNNTQTVTIQGMSSTTNGVIGLLDSATSTQIESAKSSEINVTSLGTNSISFVCKNVPTVDIPFGVLIGGGGTDVEANPSGTATETLTKLGIGSVIYEIQGGIIIGSSVTPVNDIQTLLHCANIYDKTEYTTIADVLADTVILKILIDNNNSADYLARSTEWANSVCNNATAMIYIGDNNYCANKLLDDSTWSTAICNSTYFESVLNVKVPTLSSETGSDGGETIYSSLYSGLHGYNAFDDNDATWWDHIKNQNPSYIGYDFKKNVKIYRSSVKAYSSPSYSGLKYTVQYFDTNTNTWVDATSEQQTVGGSFVNTVINTNVSSQKWRIYYTTDYDGWNSTSELQFYGRENVDNSVILVPWSTGTDRQISKMINAYYNGTLSLDEIKSVWSVGDIRSINLSAIAASGGSGATAWSVGESHRAQTVQLQILDFDHDTLETAINNKTKALITVDLKNCLRDASVSDTNGSSNTENGYMNSTGTNSGGWKSSARRAWCNNAFYNALPSDIKSLVKTVTKTSGVGSGLSSTETTQDFAFLLSEKEIFNTTTYSVSGEGTQYILYANAISNICKNPKWNGTAISSYIWMRSAPPNVSVSFAAVDANGGNNTISQASVAVGIAPAMCL